MDGDDAGPVMAELSEPSTAAVAVAVATVVADVDAVLDDDDDDAAVAIAVVERAGCPSWVENGTNDGRIYAKSPVSCATRSKNRM